MSDTLIQENISLKPYNSWKVGGHAEFLALPETVEDFKEALLWAENKKLPVTILGAGSNVLISDKGVRGLVLCTKKYSGIENLSDEKNLRISCKAGTLKQKAMRQFLKNNLKPALFLSGLPGDVDGGVVMNAGVSEAHVEPKEFVEIVESFKVLTKADSTWTEKTYKKDEINWSYRKTSGWQEGVITEVVLTWPFKDSEASVKDKVLEAQNLRRSKQPLDQPSCGSVFTNPYEHPNNTEKKSAGYLIEKAGLKGYEYGGAEISRKHANFIINKDGASALDLHCAISLAQEKVKHIFGVDLETEVKYIGDWEGVI